jgi:hypothetical protein
MRKMSWLGLVLFFSLLVYGCTGQTQAPEAAETAPAATQTEAVVANTQTSPVTEAGNEDAQCRPYNLLEEILAPVNPDLPPVDPEFDHVKGPEDARMVIIEYSDFQ